MKYEDYLLNVVKRTESTVAHFDKVSPRLVHATLGLNDETGELAACVKRSIFYGKEFDRVNFIEELGDAIWYLSVAMDELGVSMEEVMSINHDKLAARYPDTFTLDLALNRNKEKEREVLENSIADQGC